MRSCLLLAALVAVAYGGPLTNSLIDNIIAKHVINARNPLVENVILNALESLREVILHGADGVPPLEPLVVEELLLDDDVIPIPGAELEVHGLKVSHLSTFVVDRLTANAVPGLAIRYRVRLDVRLPVLEINTDHYDINLSYNGINIFGAGDTKLKIVNSRFSINVLARARLLPLKITLEETEVKWNLDSFEPVITGLFHHEGASEFVSAFLQDLVPSLVENYENEITKFLSENAHNIGNKILEDIEFSSFLS